MKNCPSCGCEAPDVSRACPACGATLDGTTASFPAVAPPVQEQSEHVAIDSDGPVLVVRKGPEVGERFYLDRPRLVDRSRSRVRHLLQRRHRLSAARGARGRRRRCDDPRRRFAQRHVRERRERGFRSVGQRRHGAGREVPDDRPHGRGPVDVPQATGLPDHRRGRRAAFAGLPGPVHQQAAIPRGRRSRRAGTDRWRVPQVHRVGCGSRRPRAPSPDASTSSLSR